MMLTFLLGTQAMPRGCRDPWHFRYLVKTNSAKRTVTRICEVLQLFSPAESSAGDPATHHSAKTANRCSGPSWLRTTPGESKLWRCAFLKSEGFSVTVAADGQAALATP